NCALTREALRRAGDLRADVATGTDYHLAKSLQAAGIPIRHEPSSIVETTYPSSVRVYVRKQRRWLRNMVLHGLRFGATREAITSLATSGIGLGMLLAPFAAFVLGPSVLAVWGAAFMHSIAAKLRYLAFTSVRFAPNGPRLSLRSLYDAGQMTLVEFYAWAQPLLDYLIPSRRSAW
ncbi:MAG: glycosyltransferase family 2 protein, partial [Chloroflexi bacterium]|nr:glycosyltransferase family 2 protein [Chloroflexota bacterium]